MVLKEYDQGTEEIIKNRASERRILERESINDNIAKRDHERLLKQKWEDDGRPGAWTPERQLEFQKLVEEAQQEALRKKALKEAEIIDEVVKEEIEEAIEPDITPITEEVIEDLTPEDIEEIPEPIPIEPVENIIEARSKVAFEMRNAADDINNESNQIEDLVENHPEWIADYKIETGKNAIWKGSITKGFREYCKEVLDIDLGD